MNNRQILSLKSKEEVASTATRRGLFVPQNEAKETTIERLLEVNQTMPPVTSVKPVLAAMNAPPVKFNHTEADILAELSQFTAAGLKVEFIDEGNTIFFSGMIHEASATRHQPMGGILSTAAYAAGF